MFTRIFNHDENSSSSILSEKYFSTGKIAGHKEEKVVVSMIRELIEQDRVLFAEGFERWEDAVRAGAQPLLRDGAIP